MLEAGRTQTVSVDVPTLPDGRPAERVELDAEGLELVGTPERTPAASPAETRFRVRVRVDAPEGPLQLTLRARYPARGAVAFPVVVTVVPPATRSSPSTFLVPALLVGLAGLVVLAGFVALRRRRLLQES